MSTHTLVTCPRCGDLQIPITDVTLHVCSTDPDRSFFAFHCAGCTSEVRQIASDKDVIRLVANGVAYRIWDIPAEALEAHTGPAITWNDVFDVDLTALCAALVSSAGASDATSADRGTTAS